MIEKHWEIEHHLRDALKLTTEPLVDTYIRQALFWLDQCDAKTKTNVDLLTPGQSEITPVMIAAGAAVLWNDHALTVGPGECEILAEAVIRRALAARL